MFKNILTILSFLLYALSAKAQIVDQSKLRCTLGNLVMNQSRMDSEGNLLHGGYQIDSVTGTGYCSLAKTDRKGNNIWARTLFNYGYGIANIAADGSCQLLATTPFSFLERFTKDGQVINGVQINFQTSISPKGTGVTNLPKVPAFFVIINFRILDVVFTWFFSFSQ